MDLNELMQDNEFKAAIEAADSADQIAELLQSKGFTVSADDVEKMLGSEQDEGEMDEQALETVAGGGLISSIWRYINAIRYNAGGGGFSTGGGGNGAFGGGKDAISGSR